jgi:hypothetical protein
MSDDFQPDDGLFVLLGRQSDKPPSDVEGTRAPSRLKARIYSALLRRQEESGPLRSLGDTRAQGFGLCVFEDLWQRGTWGEAAQCLNCCKLCHARALAEHFERAPIYWVDCPYVGFGKTQK